MKNNFYPEGATPILFVKWWDKIALYSGCAIPSIIGFWLFFKMLHSGKNILFFLLLLIVMVGLSFSFSKKIIPSISVIIYREGISKFFFFFQGKFFHRVYFYWEEIESIAYPKDEYIFVSHDGTKISLNPMSVADLLVVHSILRKILPTRLILQLDSN